MIKSQFSAPSWRHTNSARSFWFIADFNSKKNLYTLTFRSRYYQWTGTDLQRAWTFLGLYFILDPSITSYWSANSHIESDQPSPSTGFFKTKASPSISRPESHPPSFISRTESHPPSSISRPESHPPSSISRPESHPPSYISCTESNPSSTMSRPKSHLDVSSRRSESDSGQVTADVYSILY